MTRKCSRFRTIRAIMTRKSSMFWDALWCHKEDNCSINEHKIKHISPNVAYIPNVAHFQKMEHISKMLHIPKCSIFQNGTMFQNVAYSQNVAYFEPPSLVSHRLCFQCFSFPVSGWPLPVGGLRATTLNKLKSNFLVKIPMYLFKHLFYVWCS